MQGTFLVTQDRSNFMMIEDVKLQLAIGNQQLESTYQSLSWMEVCVQYGTVRYVYVFLVMI